MYPFEMQDLESEAATAMKIFSGELGGFIRVGSKGYMLPQRFKEMATGIYNMVVRTSDIFVLTYPRSGTTWTQELVWLVANNLDYDTSKSKVIDERFSFLEFAMLVHPEIKKNILEKSEGNEEKQKLTEMITSPILDQLAAAPSPRFIKSHLPLSLLPKNVLSAKVVYVARDPRDVAVSYYYMCKTLKTVGFEGDFKMFWNLFCNNLHYFTPYFDHIKEAWQNRHHPNLLFLFYEDLQKDLPAVVRRVADFFDKKYSEEQILHLCEHLHISSFKKNPSVNSHHFEDLGFVHPGHTFIGHGTSGRWREHFDEEMTAQAEQWIVDNLLDTDLRYPRPQ